MSYVFSKALQQQKSPTDEKQRRKTLPTSWESQLSNPESVATGHTPPLVAPKPKHESTDQLVKSQSLGGASRAAAFRKPGTRSYSVDYDASSGPKMGGAFARLQANLEKPNSSASSIYSEKYEAFRIQRSLKEHGVLPPELRSNEQLQKYGLDKSLAEPPKVLPKPSRETVQSKRGAFSKNRADTLPAPSTVIEESSPQKNDTRYSSLDDNSIVTSKESFTKQTISTEDNKEFSAEIQSEVTAMQDVVARKKDEIVKGQRHLNETIEELEKIKFELDSDKIEGFVKGDQNDSICHQTISEVIDVQPDNSYEKAQHAPADSSAEVLTENELIVEPTDSIELLSSQPDRPSTELEGSPAESSTDQIELSKVDDPSTKTSEIQLETTEFVNLVEEPFEVIDEPVKSIDLLNEADSSVSDLTESTGIVKPTLQIFESSTEQVKPELLEESVVKPTSPTEVSDKIEIVTQSLFPTHQENKNFSNENELEANTANLASDSPSNLASDLSSDLPSDLVSKPNDITNLTQDTQVSDESSEKILQENFSSHNADQELQEGKSFKITSLDNALQESTGHSTEEESAKTVEIDVLAEKPNELIEGLSEDHVETNVQLFTESNSFNSYTQEVTEHLSNTEQGTGANEEHVPLSKNDLEEEVDGASKIAINIEDVNNNTSAYTFDTVL